MKNIKKLLSLLLCGIMLFGMFPASLFAADGDTGDGSGTISETVVPEIHGRERSNTNTGMTLRQISMQISADFMPAIKQLIFQRNPKRKTM